MSGKARYFWPLLCLFSSWAHGLELTANRVDGQLSATLSTTAYPAKFINKEINSGLPNLITFWLTIEQAGQQVFALQQDIKVVYDLWDEVYLLNFSDSSNRQRQRTIKGKDKLRQFLGEIDSGPLLDLKRLNPDTTYRLKAQVIVNPVKSERIKKIQDWLATSKGFTPSESNKGQKTTLVVSTVSGPEGESITPSANGVRSSGPRFKKLFDQILEQYIDADELPALWRSPVTSIEFNTEQLSHASEVN